MAEGSACSYQGLQLLKGRGIRVVINPFGRRTFARMESGDWARKGCDGTLLKVFAIVKKDDVGRMPPLLAGRGPYPDLYCTLCILSWDWGKSRKVCQDIWHVARHCSYKICAHVMPRGNGALQYTLCLNTWPIRVSHTDFVTETAAWGQGMQMWRVLSYRMCNHVIWQYWLLIS